jgi:hypothetical protein
MKWSSLQGQWVPGASSGKKLPTAARLAYFSLIYFVLSILLYHFFLVPGAYWSGDSALKILQADIFRESSFGQVALPDPGSEWDPEGRYFAYRRPFAIEMQGEHYCVYPVIFTLFTAVLQTVLGKWATVLLPALGGGLLVYFSGRLAEKILPGRGMTGALLTAFAGPVLVYSCQIWEHTPAAACMIAGIWVLVRKWESNPFLVWLPAGALLAAGVWFRTEGLVFFAAVVAASFFWSGRSWKQSFYHSLLLSAGFLLGMIPFMIVNGLIYGLPLGPHAEMILTTYSKIQTRGVEMYIGDPSTRSLHRLSVLDWLFIRSTNYMGFSLKTAIPFLLYLFGCLLGPLRKNRFWNEILLGLCVAVMIRVSWEVLSSDSRTVSGLWIVMPYSILIFRLLPSLVEKSDLPRSIAFLLGIVILFFFLCGFVNIGSKGGLQWGPRYLIPAFPLLVVLFLAALPDLPGGRNAPAWVLAWTLVGFAVFFEGIGLHFIRQDELRNEQLLQSIKQENPAAIVSFRRNWLAQQCAPFSLDIPVYHVRNREELRAFLDTEKPFPNEEVLLLSYREEPAPAGQFDCREPIPLYRLCRPGTESSTK